MRFQSRFLPLLLLPTFYLSGGCSDRPLALPLTTEPPAPCPGTPPRHACIHGPVVHFDTGARLAPDEIVHLAAYDAATLLDAHPTPLAETDAAGDYIMPDVPSPPSGWVAVMTTSPNGQLQPMAHQAPIYPDALVALTALTAPHSLMSEWSRQAAGQDFRGSGAVVLRFLTGARLRLAPGAVAVRDGVVLGPSDVHYLAGPSAFATDVGQTTEFGVALVAGDGESHLFAGADGYDGARAGSRVGLIYVCDLFRLK